MANQSCDKTCAHYIDENKMPIYKYKFLIIISITTLVIVFLFVLYACFYKQSLDKIVDYHAQYTNQALATLPDVNLTKDSCFYLDERLISSIDNHMIEVQTMLDIQCAKIQSDFTILSLWAGILMIVFLIFSIYSVFKTDEMMRQGRETLKVLEKTEKDAGDKINKIENVVQAEINKVKIAASNELSKISTSAEEMSKETEEFKETTKKELKQELDIQINLFRKEIKDFLEQTKKTDNDKKEFINKLFDICISQMDSETKDQLSEQSGL